ncbi:TPR end-of-group domain-containing protein [uncultured Bacteroides sp.]|uniref:TPR end-of-group domain-containing protein n=1 Tax=uncultured Bacteroides sp. TaxID=162156 RepID=UPI002AAA62EE|nr:transglutaminase domain-containing protein [uncultured Bacteroides sp.]
MKRILYLLFAVLCTSYASAQITKDDVSKYINEQNAPIQKARETNDYKKLEGIYNGMIKTFESYPQNIKEETDSYIGGLYYNLACYQSCQKKKKQAVASFVKATEHQWISYAHAVRDHDLDNIRKEKQFIFAMDKIRDEGDYSYILKQGGGYVVKADSSLPQITYLAPNDSNLVRIRQYFNLDSVAGSGNEISKIKNLLHWAHNVVRHDGASPNPESKNAIDLVNICKKENRGINCRMMAMMLNECYLAMGFKSRYVVCLPKKYINDCHVINAVYSNTLDKWIWIDPTFEAYVTDDKGNMLGIAEVRERLLSGAPLHLNEDANWNNKQKETQEEYLDFYMTKNLYRLECAVRNEYNIETKLNGKPLPAYISLDPSSTAESKSEKRIVTNNDKYFWQCPEE